MQQIIRTQLGQKIRCIMIAVCTTAVLASGASAGAVTRAQAAAADQPSRERSYAEVVGKRAIAWLTEKNVSPAAQSRAVALWADLPAPDDETQLLSFCARTFACGDSRAAALLELCSRPRKDRTLMAYGWLMRVPSTKADAFMSANLRLFYARWLVRHSLYDEAYDLLDRLQPQDVVAPNALLFFQAATCRQLLKTDEALAAAERLLQRRQDCPRRYHSLARLIRNDLQRLSDENLDHIARRMDDVRRRLDLGRSGERTQTIENGIIASLDKLIKNLEEQQKPQSADAGRGNAQPSNPASDSRPMGGRGQGRVVQRDIGSKKGWGNLPAKQRQEAMQQVGREFPAHYRDIIEQYFRKLADQEE